MVTLLRSRATVVTIQHQRIIYDDPAQIPPGRMPFNVYQRKERDLNGGLVQASGKWTFNEYNNITKKTTNNI